MKKNLSIALFFFLILPLSMAAADYAKVVVTPAGRESYLSLLYRNLAKQTSDFDEWHLWINTSNPSDIAYCNQLAEKNSWIKTIPCECPINGNISLGSFYKKCMDDNTVYLKLDDDVVFLDNFFVKKMFSFRLRCPHYFLVFANIINNSCIAFIHQQNGIFDYTNPVEYDSFCSTGWVDPKFAEHLHRCLILDLKHKRIKKWYFDKWLLRNYERVSINAISWFGRDFILFDGEVGNDDEHFLTTVWPKKIGVPNVVYGRALCAHFSFFTQRDYLDKTDILDLYREIVNQ